MSPQKCQFACAAVLLLGLCSAAALTGVRPTLTNAVWSAGQFQFTLHGETNASYIVESSSDLRAWTPAVTNSDPQPTRVVTMPAETNMKFWRVRPAPGPLFEYAIVARDAVNLGGSGRIDSFNSTNEMESTRGRYDPAKATDRAVIATASRTANALNVGNMKIAGFVSTGPGATVTVSPNGGVGSLTYLYNPANAGTIESGHYRIDPFQVVLPDAKLPRSFGPTLMPGPGSVGGTNYTYVFGSADYMITELALSSSQKAIVMGAARVHVTGNVSISAQAYLAISTGSSLELYVGGTNATIAGGGIVNPGSASNSMYFGLSANTNVSVSGSASLVGTIYAPNASVTLMGTSAPSGAIVGKTVTFTGTMDFHFDESLKSAGPFY